MKRIVTCLVSFLCVMVCFAKSKIETYYMQSGNSPIMEIHCIWTIEDDYITNNKTVAR